MPVSDILKSLVLLGIPVTAGAQTADHAPIRWWHPIAAGAAVTATFIIDEPVRDFLQDHRSATLDDIGTVASDFKDPLVFQVAGGGAVVLGLALRQPQVARTGAQIIGSYGLASLAMIGTKWVFGRARPRDQPDDPTSFDWFDGNEDASFPSGSSAVVFSLATTLADAIGNSGASVAIYSAATLNAWARMNSDRHWLSDMTLGALYGVTAARIVNGRWRIMGLRPPAILVGPDRAAITTGFDF